MHAHKSHSLAFTPNQITTTQQHTQASVCTGTRTGVAPTFHKHKHMHTDLSISKSVVVIEAQVFDIKF